MVILRTLLRPSKAALQDDDPFAEEVLTQRQHAAIRLFRVGLTHRAASGALIALGVGAGLLANTGSPRISFAVTALVGLVIAGVAAIGYFLAMHAHIAFKQEAIDQIRRAMSSDPHTLEQELRLLLEDEGVSDSGARLVTRIIASNQEPWLHMLLAKRYGLSVEVPAHLGTEALFSGLVALTGAALPIVLVPLLSFGPALGALGIGSAIVLASSGTISARLTGRRPILVVLEWWAVAAIIGVAGFGLGALLPGIR